MSDDLTPHPQDDAATGHEPGERAGRSGDEGGGARRARPERGSSHPVAHAIREFVIVVVLALILSLAVKSWLMQAFYIPSESMENTLMTGDRVIVSKLTPHPFSLKRGDIVVFEDPGHWLPQQEATKRSGVSGALHDSLVFVGLLPNDSDSHLIKRVIGLPGDHVKCCTAAGKITVNGAEITEPYLKPGNPPSVDPFDVTVPAGRLWVMGDHRSDSADSRYHGADGDPSQGAVPESKVVGRAVAVVWPLNDMTWLGRPSDVYSKVPSAK